MTRESLPDFDLYAELEVSRLASVEVIDAAYRVLAKRHHPDVSQPMDGDRIKRLNLAHNWLIDPARRRRYDNATKPATAPLQRGNWDASDAATIDLAVSARLASKAFGPNTSDVRAFLADLRGLDELRAWAIRDGKATADADAYEAAQHAAFTIGQVERRAEWLLAREAAAVIARGKLADSPLQAEITGVLSDVAGAIVIRDLIQPGDYDQLLLPWVWREPRSSPSAAVGLQTVRGAAGAAAANLVGARRTLTSAPVMAVIALVTVVALAGAWSLLTGSKGPQPAVANDSTGGPTAGLTTAGAPSAMSSPSAAASSGIAFESSAPSPTLGPGATAGPTATGAPGQTFRPGPTPKVTPRPTTVPTPGPSPLPTPVQTPIPTPSPAVFCTVPTFVGTNTSSAPGKWTTAGFTGTITYSPAGPYQVAWQSLTAGASVLCTSDITLADVAPSP